MGPGQRQVRDNRGKTHYSHSEDRDALRTPGPRRADTPEQNVVLQLQHYLGQHEVNPIQVSADLLTEPVEVQQRLAEIVFALIGYWAELDEFKSSDHPLKHVTTTATRMVNGLFV